MEYITHSAAETEELGARLAQRLRPGMVLAFTGDLGAGKTAFVSGLARGLGIRDRVTSPTFTIVNEYEGGRLPLFHFDLYRLSGADELFDLANFVGVSRPGVDLRARDISHLPAEKVTRLEVPALAISSTECRKRVGEGLPLWYLVPDGVVQYVAKRGLYTPANEGETLEADIVDW
jgi:hypothetical protein